jgi:hypothetical protein
MSASFTVTNIRFARVGINVREGKGSIAHREGQNFIDRGNRSFTVFYAPVCYVFWSLGKKIYLHSRSMK